MKLLDFPSWMRTCHRKSHHHLFLSALRFWWPSESLQGSGYLFMLILGKLALIFVICDRCWHRDRWVPGWRRESIWCSELFSPPGAHRGSLLKSDGDSLSAPGVLSLPWTPLQGSALTPDFPQKLPSLHLYLPPQICSSTVLPTSATLTIRPPFGWWEWLQKKYREQN